MSAATRGVLSLSLTDSDRAQPLQHSDQARRANTSPLTFANAIHEIDDARGALDEISRVLTDDGKLLVVEFNLRGYELIAMHHQMQGRGEHRNGEMSTEDIDQYLRASFDCVETREFSLTHAWVASGKKI